MGISHNYQNKKAVVLITVIIFVIIMSILAVSVLFVMTNEARTVEYNIKRIKANYAAQAGFQHYLELLKTIPAPGQVVISVDSMQVTTEMFAPAAGPATCPNVGVPSDCIESSAEYN